MDRTDLLKYAAKFESLKIACLREAADLKEAERMMRPITEKAMRGLQNRLQREGIRLETIKALPAQKASTSGANPNSYYSIVWYGLMTDKSKYGRCGVIQVTTTFNNDPDEQDIAISMRAKLGGDKGVLFPSSSPVGVVTRVLNYINQLERVGKGVDFWIQTYVPSSEK